MLKNENQFFIKIIAVSTHPWIYQLTTPMGQVSKQQICDSLCYLVQSDQIIFVVELEGNWERINEAHQCEQLIEEGTSFVYAGDFWFHFQNDSDSTLWLLNFPIQISRIDNPGFQMTQFYYRLLRRNVRQFVSSRKTGETALVMESWRICRNIIPG